MALHARGDVLVVVGTRPEAVKLAPVVLALAGPGRPDGATGKQLRPRLVTTGQHPDLVAGALAAFGLHPAVDLGLGGPGRPPAAIAAAVLTALTDLIRAEPEGRSPAAVVVQGDTTTSFAASLAAFYAGVPLVHVEAGLRTGSVRAPFPEEANRRMTTVLADLHLAPTNRAGQRLRAEGVAADRVVVTGNTGIDALLAVAGRAPLPGWLAGAAAGQPVVLVTMHRRESWGEPMRRAASGLARVARARPGARFVLPLHPNPVVREVLAPVLSGLANVDLVEPLDYLDTVAVLRRCDLVLTDSGGLQEEAPSLGKPVLVLRETTERPEGVDAGVARLVGTDPDTIAAALFALLDDPAARERMVGVDNPYGDGRAARRCVEAIEHRLGLRANPPQPWLAGRTQLSQGPIRVAS